MAFYGNQPIGNNYGATPQGVQTYKPATAPKPAAPPQQAAPPPQQAAAPPPQQAAPPPQQAAPAPKPAAPPQQAANPYSGFGGGMPSNLAALFANAVQPKMNPQSPMKAPAPNGFKGGFGGGNFGFF